MTSGTAVEKACTVCKRVLPLTEYYRNRLGKYGKHSQCKDCSRERARIGMAKWRAENPEAERKRCSDWAKRNRATKNAQSRRWAANNRDKVAAKARRDRAANPEKFAERGRVYRTQNPHKVRQHSAAASARRRNAPGPGVTADEWRDVVRLQSSRCAYCGRKARVQMDHVVPLASGGRHEPQNVVPACGTCNRSKGDRPLLVWLFWKCVVAT